MGLSSLTNVEYINLVGHYNKLLHGETQVNYKARGYTEEQIKAIEEANLRQETAQEIQSLNIVFKRNINEFNFPSFDDYYFMFDKFDNHGLLPFPGTLLEQPSKIIELFQILKNIKMEEEQRQFEEQKRKVNKNGWCKY